MRPSVDLAPVRKRLRTFSAQFYDFRLVRAQIAAARRRTLRIMVRIVRQGKEIARYWDFWENSMRKISLVAAIALMLAGVGVWATSNTQARIDAPAGALILTHPASVPNSFQIMMGARDLPVAHYDDYSLVFN